MNFEFLSKYSELSRLLRYCEDAERFADGWPELSAAQSRKAAEFSLRMFYAVKLDKSTDGLAVEDILSDWDLMHSIPDREIIDAFQFVRRTARNAESGTVTAQDALEALGKLHYFVGECGRLIGLFSDYPAFAPEAVEREDLSAQVAVDDEQLRLMLRRLREKRCPAFLENPQTVITNVRVSTREERREIREGIRQSGTDSGANAKMSYQVLAKYVLENTPGVEIYMEPKRSEIILVLADRKVTVSVRTGCTNLGTRAENGEWQLLSGIDYIIYAPILTDKQPLPEQFRVLTRQEFLGLWEEMRLVRSKVSSQAMKRYREMFGADSKIDANKYGDVKCVQSFLNSRPKTNRLFELLGLFPSLADDGLEKILSR